MDLATIKGKILRLLGDDITEENGVIEGTKYPHDLLVDAVHAALTAIVSKSWETKIIEIDEEGDQFELPADVIDIEAVFDIGSGVFLPQLLMGPGADISLLGNAWHLYPSGHLTFVNSLSSKGATIYYSGIWSAPEDDDDDFTAPVNTLTATLLFAASYCLLNQASATADTAVFKSRIDSGTPVDNPAKELSDFFLKRFEIEMQRIPAKQKGYVR